jgi:TPR repeat protein
MYIMEKGVAKDDKEGYKWILSAAKPGLDSAQLKLASHYFEGLEVPKNVKEAVKWAKLATKQNYPGAQEYIDEVLVKARSESV